MTVIAHDAIIEPAARAINSGTYPRRTKPVSQESVVTQEKDSQLPGRVSVLFTRSTQDSLCIFNDADE